MNLFRKEKKKTISEPNHANVPNKFPKFENQQATRRFEDSVVPKTLSGP